METPEPDQPMACCTAVLVASHHVSGSCSAQPGCGRRTGYSALPVPRTVPSGSTTSALTEDVPRSMPRNASLMAWLGPCVIRADNGRRLDVADCLTQRRDGRVETPIHLVVDRLIDGNVDRLGRDLLLTIAHRSNCIVDALVHTSAEPSQQRRTERRRFM